MKTPLPVLAAVVAVAALLITPVSAATSKALNTASPVFPDREAGLAIATAASTGDAAAQFTLGSTLLRQKGHERAALVWLGLSAVGGNLHAARTAAHYYQSHGNIKEAARWLYRAGQLDDGEARQQFLDLFLSGKTNGIEGRDGAAWATERALITGNPQIKLALGRAYELGQGIAPDEGEAVRWYRDAALDGNIEAMTRLGRLQLLAAARWRVPSKETDANNRWTGPVLRPVDTQQADLGLISTANAEKVDPEQLIFVRPGMTEGEAWLRRAARLGSADAKVWAARSRLDGVTLPMNPQLAMRWLLSAGCAGNMEALTVLARVNALEHNGAPRDAVRAWVFWDVAVRLGDQMSANDRDWIAHSMTPRQLARAKAIAQDWCVKP